MMCGLERFNGSVGEKKGTFVFQRTGKFSNGAVESKWTVIPGSGTGQLKGIYGEVDFRSGPGKEFPIAFIYRFDVE